MGALQVMEEMAAAHILGDILLLGTAPAVLVK
jgi:hypothetical protein